jgi:hypothetical protein
MSFREALKGLVAWIVFSALMSGAAEAQWSLLAPGDRAPSRGQNRYAMLVFANPVPGLENDFNDWYTTTHMGDLVQLPGWLGAQRFRIISSLNPRPTKEGYRHGYLIVWDQEGSDYATPQRLMTAAINGGKSRRGAGFDYIGGTGGGGTFEVMGPRVSSGKTPFMPAVTDVKTPRPNRYIVMDFSNPAGGKEGEFEVALNQHIRDVLALPGWMAAQRYKLAPAVAGRGGRPNKPQYLTTWEVEAQHGQNVSQIQSALNEAVKAGKVKAVPIDETTWEFTYWEPITPYITKQDFVR